MAGDAAGLVETLFGEGLYYALRSGELAATAVGEALARGIDPAPTYGRGLKRDILPELIWSRRLRRILYASQSLGFMAKKQVPKVDNFIYFIDHSSSMFLPAFISLIFFCYNAHTE